MKVDPANGTKGNSRSNSEGPTNRVGGLEAAEQLLWALAMVLAVGFSVQWNEGEQRIIIPVKPANSYSDIAHVAF